MPEPPAPIGFHLADEGDPQVPAEAAVITPTIGRPELADAVRSVYRQDFAGRIQMLIGVDKSAAPDAALLDMLEGRPGNVSVTVLRLPYSTSARHGGVHTAADGGSLRTVLSFMANAPRLAYLDDDNEWLPEHLSALSARSRARPGRSATGWWWTATAAANSAWTGSTRWGWTAAGSRRSAASSTPTA
ncbi:MAG: glycosyltransferase family A protein [Caulobacteraceae bacterium]